MGLLIIFASFIVLAIGFYALKMIVGSRYEDWPEFIGSVLAFVGVIGLVLALLFIPINRHIVKAAMEEHFVLQETVEAYRMSNDVIYEVTALGLKVAESNMVMARCQYAHGSFFLNIYNPKEVMDVEMILMK